MKNLEGKIIGVAGATGAVAKPMTLALHKAGATVIIFARNMSDLAAMTRTMDERVMAVAGDGGKPEDVRRFFAETLERFGRMDAVVTAIGTHEALGIDATLEEFVESFDNLNKKMLLPGSLINFHAQQVMRGQATGGAIFNISSHAAVRINLEDNVTYGPVKAASTHLMKILNYWVEDPRVRFFDLQPATVNTLKNAKWLPTEEDRRTAVQPESIAQYVIDHLDDPKGDTLKEVIFDAPIN
jgi:3-oxoacyl-[acyl-carrier protein] reductase